MEHKYLDDTLKETFLEQFDENLTQKDNNSAVFEFENDPTNKWIHNKPLKDFLDVLDMVFSDYSIRISRTSGHSKLQVFMRLEEGLWKVK